MKLFLSKFYLIFAVVLLLASCGTEDSLTGSETSTDSSTSGSSAASITLTASSPLYASGSGDTIDLTAVVKDANQNLLSDQPVTFTATASSNVNLQVTQGTTDSSGQATALMSTNDSTNRVVTITAAAGNYTSSVNITIFGTAISISGPSNITFGSTADFTLSLTDFSGSAIVGETVTVTSTQANPITATGPTGYVTNASGQVLFSVTINSTTNDTLTATALGATGTHSFTITGDSFNLTVPAEIFISTCQAVTAEWISGGIPQAGASIGFSATRGNIYTDAGCTTPGSSAATDAAGIATVWINSTTPGPVSLTATTSSGLSTNAASEFVATTPAALTLQADNIVLVPNGTSTLTATVRDANGNLVKNAQVDFKILQDTTQGSISPASDVTDSLGRAQTVFSATDQSSAENGIIIQATVNSTALVETIELTVGASALYVTIALPNLIGSPSDASYEIQGDVLVADAAGIAVANQDVNLKIIPTRYDKGVRVPDTSDTWYAYSSVDVTGFPVQKDLACLNEDFLTGDPLKDGNGVLDAGEDLNGSGSLEPGNVAVIDSTVTTGSDGRATFTFTYPKDNGDWTQVKLTATTSVSGSENADTKEFLLPVAANDVTGGGIVGATSPYGTGTSCADPN